MKEWTVVYCVHCPNGNYVTLLPERAIFIAKRYTGYITTKKTINVNNIRRKYLMRRYRTIGF